MKRLIVICGAPGSGKTTIQNYLLEKYEFPRVITHTTRPRRIGEKDKVDYYFESKKEFFLKITLLSLSNMQVTCMGLLMRD